MKNTRWINRVAILGVILIMTIGGLWLWDAKNYPIPGIPDIVDPFGNSFPRLSWDRNKSFPDNISQVQQWIRSKKQRRLQKKWISSLEFEDSYWILQDPFGPRETPVVHFAENGRIEVRTRQKQSHLFSNSSGYRHPANETLIIEFNNGTIKTLSILAISENRFVLVESNESHAVVLEESPDSTYFDSLPKTAE